MSFLRNPHDDSHLRLLVCGYTRILPNRWNFSKISLPFWRFYWNASPGASIRCDGETIDLLPSVAVIIRSNTVFSTRNEHPCDHLYVHFQVASAMNHPAAPKIFRLEMDSSLKGISETLCRHLNAEEPPAWRVSLVARSLTSMALAMTNLYEGDAPKTDVRILKVLSHMDEHLKPCTSNADLAKVVGMSVGALNHLFKDQVGQSLQAFLRTKRIEKAALLLQMSDLSIEQIAEETGFCDRYHLSRVFSTQQGISPAAYRQSHSNPFRS